MLEEDEEEKKNLTRILTPTTPFEISFISFAIKIA